MTLTRCLYLFLSSISTPPLTFQPTPDGFQPNDSSEYTHFYINLYRAKCNRIFSSLLWLRVASAFKTDRCPLFLKIICFLGSLTPYSPSTSSTPVFLWPLPLSLSRQCDIPQGSVLGHLFSSCVLYLINSIYSYKFDDLPHSICWWSSNLVSILEFSIDRQTYFPYIPDFCSWGKQLKFIFQKLDLLPPPIPRAVNTILVLLHQ